MARCRTTPSSCRSPSIPACSIGTSISCPRGRQRLLRAQELPRPRFACAAAIAHHGAGHLPHHQRDLVRPHRDLRVLLNGGAAYGVVLGTPRLRPDHPPIRYRRRRGGPLRHLSQWRAVRRHSVKVGFWSSTPTARWACPAASTPPPGASAPTLATASAASAAGPSSSRSPPSPWCGARSTISPSPATRSSSTTRPMCAAAWACGSSREV
jgi:hypothetical protein